ncbi:spore germination protein [Bacillus lacus]|uniref:Spore germination protein n=1 Tax=Metabacillus lacus TaxID=1983721 RepID=A0A7X2J1D7_9BACI|nr:spore germination protein [Metabacillus lacus]MRX72883.1 spore germination protein [Metabacillus lacus]
MKNTNPENQHPEYDLIKELVDSLRVQKELYSDISENKEVISKVFGDSYDLIVQDMLLGDQTGFICYLSSMADKQKVALEIWQPLSVTYDEQKDAKVIKSLGELKKLLYADRSSSLVTTFHELLWKIVTGHVVISFNGIPEMLALQVGGIEKRTIVEPSTQTILRGPKDGFVEDIQTNMSLIRRRVKNPRIRFEASIIGAESRTTVVLAYINDYTSPKIVEEIRSRMNSINTSAILDSGNVEEFLTDETFTPFPLILNSERPDSIAANLMEGKAAILVDGSPFVLVVPSVFSDFFQATEDYYQPFFMASFVRLIRYIAFMISLILPSLYVALTTFHPELMPTALLISIQAQRESVPVPAVVEILLMELTFEILREAGVRMPRAVGQTVSIVGALVIGQAAVEAGLVSNVLIIIVAFTAISSFVTPIYNFSMSTRLLRFILILGAAMMGLYAVLLLLVVMVIHLTSLRSFGVPYLIPFAPFSKGDQDDVMIRTPIWANRKKPSYLKPQVSEKIQEQDGETT